MVDLFMYVYFCMRFWSAESSKRPAINWIFHIYTLARNPYRDNNQRLNDSFACHLSPFTRHFFLTNNHTPRDTIPRTRLAVAQARGPSGPHFVVANVNPGSRTPNRKAHKITNIPQPIL